MKLTQIQQQEILQVHESYWSSYLTGDVPSIAALLDEGYTQVGSAETEVFSNKKDAVRFLYDTINQVAGKLEMRNRTTKIDDQTGGVFEDTASLVIEQADIYVLTEGEWMFYSKFRASTFLQKKNDQWKIIHQHSSFPDTRADEGQNIATEKIAAENLQLREAVKRRTIELEQKNRDLEIEASLERVRAVAMGMKQPGDLLDICEILYTELQALGFAELRNAMINIHDDDKGSFLNYDYSDRAGKTITTILYNSHPSTENLVKQVKKSNDAFAAIEIKGSELNKWREYRKSMGEEDDPRLENTETLTYYFYSIGIGAIGISTYNPVTEEKRNVLQRFRNVFDFAYRRYSDVTKAEAQARESQIETALERVRARAMSMHTSKELIEVANVLREQMGILGQHQIETMAIHLYRDDAELFDSWYAGRDQTGKLVSGTTRFKKDSCWLIREFMTGYQSGRQEYTIEASGQKLQEWLGVLVAAAPEYESTVADFPEKSYYHVTDFSGGSMIMVAYQTPGEETKDLQKRCAKVFDLAYRRFLDIKQAEAQARDAQIELSLERVRAKTMAMHNTQDVGNTVATMFEQLVKLGVVTNRCGILIFTDNYHAEVWTAKSNPEGHAALIVGQLDIRIHQMLQSVHKAWKENESFFHYELKGGDIVDYYKAINNYRDYPTRFNLESLPSYEIHSDFFFSEGSVFAFTSEPLSVEVSQIFKRFAGVFGQTYRRYLDLQKAEAQAREAHIEVAVERVRAKALAMHHSEEITGVARVLRNELGHLNIEGLFAATIYLEQDDGTIRLWDITIADNLIENGPKSNWDLKVRLEELHPQLFIKMIWDSTEKYFVVEQKEQDFPILIDWVRQFKKQDADEIERAIKENNIQQTWFAGVQLEHGRMSIELLVPPPNEVESILSKIGAAFDLAYKRFLDLQKAEAQAREAQIEASLERVRAKTMAMHNSQEVGETVATMFAELVHLGVESIRSGILIIEETKHMQVWTASSNPTGKIGLIIGRLNMMMHPLWRGLYDAWKNHESVFTYELMGQDLINFFEAVNNSPGYPFKYDIETLPTKQIYTDFFFPEGALFAFTEEPIPEETSKLLKRFAGVFGQTYRRYLDLQKAEAQAREAKIEASLEKVRGRAMAMHKSDELLEAGSLLYKELFKLGIPSLTSGYVLMDEDERMGWNYGVNPTNGSILPQPVGIPHTESQVMEAIKAGWKNQDPFFVLQLDPEETIKHQTYIAEQSINFPLSAAELIAVSPERLVLQSFNFKQGYLLIVGGEVLPMEKLEMVARFTKVFEMTYRRFLDLKQAEEQTREAQIELGLERVRARAMAMRTSEELNALIGTVFMELTRLDLALTRCVIMIYEPATNDARWWMANSEAPDTPMNFLVKYHELAPNLAYFNAWKKKNLKFQYILESIEKKEWDDFLFSETELSLLPDFVIAGMKAPDRVYLNASFNNFGNLTLASLEPLSNEHFDILLRFAKVFDLTYTRFNDLQKAEEQAKEARTEAALERVRSSSMAMHQSGDLHEVIKVVTEQLCGLHLKFDVANFAKVDQKGNWDIWLSTPAQAYPAQLFVPYFDHPIFNRLIEIQNKKIEFYSDVYGYEEKNRFFKHFFENTEAKSAPESRKQHVLNRKGFARTLFLLKNIWFAISNYDGIPFSENEIEIFRRFAHVFEQAYVRFLDLQKAEAQAREAQIEVSLERVRSKAMAMQKSEDLADAVAIVFEELDKLNLGMLRCGIGILDKEKRSADVWTTTKSDNDTVVQVSGDESMDIHPLLQGAFDAWLKQEDHSYILKGEDLNHYYKAIAGTNFKLPDSQSLITGSDGIQQYYYSAVFSSGSLFAFRETEFPEEAKIVLKRFADVFNLTYTRFNDLKQAEAQTKEAKLEASLERVRSKAMAMHNSQDLAETIKTFYHQIEALSVIPRRLGIGIINKDVHSVELVTMNSTDQGDSIEIAGTLALKGHPVLEGIYDNWLSQTEYRPVLKGIELREYYKIVRPQIPYPDYPTSYAQYGYFFFFPEGGVYAWTEQEMSEDELQIYRRFTSVLSLTYKRFKDLKEAEAQARESQIQLALERVRARTMAMQRSEELADASEVLFKQFAELGNEPDRISIGIIDETSGFTDVWATDQSGSQLKVRFKARNDEKTTIQRMVEAWKAGKKSTIIDLQGADLNEWIRYIREELGMAISDEHFNDRRLHQVSFFSQGWLNITTLAPVTDEVLSLLDRFAAVFNLTFTRFLDLKKAEAQTRQAQIETAMEKVRARSLAMQKPEELKEVAQVLRKEMALLGVEELETCSIYIHDETSGKTNCWYAIKSVEGVRQAVSSITPPVLENSLVSDYMTIDLRDTWVGREMYEFYHSDQQQTSILMQGEPRKEWIKYCIKKSDLFDDTFYGENIPDRTYHLSKFSKGYLGAASPGNISAESWELLQRATAVFSFAYTRFSDLQLAEAQAREATIEAALEKVRGKAMAMHNSKDLTATASLVFTELRKLGLNLIRSGVSLQSKENRKNLLYSATSATDGDSLALVGSALLDDHPILSAIYDNWLKGVDYFPVLKVEEIETYYEKIRSNFLVPDSHAGKEQYGYYLSFSEGTFYGWSEKTFSESELTILHRFKLIIDLTFRRYIELQKSEANARDAVKKASLDRVRAEIASMRTTSDLERITPLMWNELTTLGVPFIRCGVFIMDEEEEQIHTFLSTPEGKAIASFNTPFANPGALTEALPFWRRKEIYKTHWNETQFLAQAKSLMEQGSITSPETYLTENHPTSLYLHFLPFLQGMLYVGSETALTEEEVQLVQNLADAFSTAYARYEDFNKLESAKVQVEKTLMELKQAQTQLIQSEKMASLGELTAGIAHEIQNPLNFVNNFSEVNTELIDEIKQAVQSGNNVEILALAENVKLNLEKINFHGKRADGIVKSMLQHSRSIDQSGKNKKEPTDINVLADEYLRLAYHGLRAKDKTFNATLQTDFDETLSVEGSAKADLGMIEVVSQDIARAILNLITNAFYAVHERDKKKEKEDTYSPTVSVSTKRLSKHIEIRVKDNGPGIPQHVLDKIFQPFFTTKPTGQGTGLGLSLAYDIVKAHGGELKVLTGVGVGSEFIIQLPY